MAGERYASEQFKDAPLPVKCAVSLCGPADLLNLDGYTDEERAKAEALLSGFIGGTAEDMPDVYRQASPLYQIRAGAPPVFIAHGTLDQTVPFCQSERFYKAALSAGLDITFVPVENADHTFRPAKGGTLLPGKNNVLERLLDFLLKKLIFGR